MLLLNKYPLERYFFFAVIVLNLIPVVSWQFFPTLDGPAHLYNAHLIGEMLFGNSDFLTSFYIFNPVLVPNWTGHFMLTLVGFIAPAFVAEKVLLLFYFIGLPLAFRALIKVISPGGLLFSYFIFPFAWSFPLFLGFYNFSLALVFLFATLAYWLKNRECGIRFGFVWKLSLLLIITFFSHVFVFGLLLMIMALKTGYDWVVEIGLKPTDRKARISVFLQRDLALVLAGVVPMLLFATYWLGRPEIVSLSFMDVEELKLWIKNIRPIIALSFLTEEEYTVKLLYILMALVAVAFYQWIADVERNFKGFSLAGLKQLVIDLFSKLNFWVLVALVFLVLYFKMPDDDGYAGYISVRLGLLFFMFLIVWLSVERCSKLFVLLAVAGVLYINFSLVRFYREESGKLSKIAVACYEASSVLEPNSVVLPVNYIDNWLTGHFSGYLGLDKPMVILDNYEAGTGYFPLKWKESSFPELSLEGAKNGVPCVSWRSNKEGAPIAIDYVFVMGDMASKTDSCHMDFKNIVTSNYTPVFNNEFCTVYKWVTTE